MNSIFTVWNFYFDLLAVHGSSVEIFNGNFCISFIGHCDETVTFAGVENIILREHTEWLLSYQTNDKQIFSDLPLAHIFQIPIRVGLWDN